MPEKTFVHNLTDVVLAQRAHVYPTNETYLSNLIFYQMDEGRTSSVSMNGKDRIEAFSTWLVEHVGLPKVDWDKTKQMIVEAAHNHGITDATTIEFAVEALLELYDRNELPKPPSK